VWCSVFQNLSLCHIALQCVTGCRRVLQYVVVCCSVLHCDAHASQFMYRRRKLQHTATQFNTLQHRVVCNGRRAKASRQTLKDSHCNTLQHTATRCDTLQHTATHCNTLQHTATHCNTLQHTATHCNTGLYAMADERKQVAEYLETGRQPLYMDETAPEEKTPIEDEKRGLQHTATYCNILQHTATYCNTQNHAATHRDTL